MDDVSNRILNNCNFPRPLVSRVLDLLGGSFASVAALVFMVLILRSARANLHRGIGDTRRVMMDVRGALKAKKSLGS